MILESSGGCCESIFNGLESPAVAVKPFAYFYNEIFMVLEASAGCCESIIHVLESPGGCCEAICAL